MWQIILVVIVIALSIAAISFVSASTKSTTSDSKLTTKFYDKLFLVQVQNSLEIQQQEQILTEIQNLESVDFVMTDNLAFFQTPSVVARMRRPVVFIPEEDYNKFLNVFNLKLVAGNLPQKSSNQLVFTTEGLKNRDLRIGSNIGKSVSKDDPFLPGKYDVSGELQFNNPNDKFFIGIGNIDFVKGQEISHFIKPKKGLENQLHQDLLDLEQKYLGIAVETQQTYSKFAEKEVQGADFINNMITGVVTLSSSVSVVLLIILFINFRIRDIATFIVLGYSNGFVYFKVFLEIFFKIILGWVAGIITAQLLFNYLNWNIFEPRAIRPLSVFQPEVLINSGFLPVALIIINLVVVIWKVNRISLVELVNPR